MARIYKTKTSKKRKFKISKKVVIGGIFTITILLLIVSFVFGDRLSSINKLTDSGSFDPLELGEILGVNEEKEKPWWNDDYPYSIQLTIVNQDSFNPLSIGNIVDTTFNHKKLVDENKSIIDGKDLVLLYFNDETEEFEELKFELVDPNNENTKIKFELPVDIDPFANEKDFCLFYGNLEFSNANITSLTQTTTSINTDYVINFGAETKSPVFAKTNRKWILKGAEGFPEYSELVYSIELKDTVDPIATPTFEVIGTETKGTLEQINNSDNYEARIKLDELTAGSYQIRATAVNSNGIEQRSPKSTFIVSAPLYVAWTIDWEGYDTGNETLKSMDDFSAKYDTPMTHFWNPRSNIAVNKERNEYLLNWVKNRKSSNGDEIGLHLHMYYDMVKATGVTPKYDPQWANRNTGSDVPMYIYSYEEQVKMIEWAKSEFTKAGLDEPKSFRTGGWMADMDTLKALESTGFLLDSSARTQYSFGEYKVEEVPEEVIAQATIPTIELSTEEGSLYEANEEPAPPEVIRRDPTPEEVDHYLKFIEDRNYINTSVDGEIIPLANFVSYKVEGKWDVPSTAKPYKPSTTNINKPGNTSLDLWEFPNNGADSWRFNANQLTQRFKENYKNEPINEPQVLTYLTHPHAIHVDMPKMEATYAEIDLHNASTDSGPVIYVTLQEAYEDISGNKY